MRKNSAVIICVTGYSGTGKSTVINTLLEILPNAHAVYFDNFWPDYIIQFPNRVEKILREPVNTNDGLSYIEKFEKKLTAEAKKELWEAFYPYASIRVNEAIDSIVLAHKPLFIIVETSPALDIWKKSDYKLFVQTNKQERRLELLSVRKIFSADKKTVEKRDFAGKERIEGVRGFVDYTVNNNYDENFFVDVQNLASRIKEMFGMG